MKKITISLKQKESTSSIFIGKDLLDKISSLFNTNKYSKVFIVTDANIHPLFTKKVISGLSLKTSHIVLSPGEGEKNIKTVQKIWEAMHQAECDRKTLVINLGGGVITDIGGLAASTFMRGVDFINIPTSLLAQVDASVGGKTGIDFLEIKNLIGTFNQPIGVIIDVKTLHTLPKKEFLSSFAEIIKHGLIKDKTYFEIVTAKHPLEFTQKEMINIITKSIAIKAAVVREDETENNARKLLNFGHTIGHAIESLGMQTKTPLLHGEAVSLGMLIEAKISMSKHLLSKSEFQKIQNALSVIKLPEFKFKKKEILNKIKSDKKNEKGKIHFTLLSGIGNAVYNQNLSEDVIFKSLKGMITA